MGTNLLLFIMVVGQTMARGSSWNLIQPENKRLSDPSGLDLRASTLINYQCSSSGPKGCLDCGSFPFCQAAGTSAYKITCNSGQVCESTGTGSGLCLSYTDSRVAQCKCDAAYVDDPYDASGNKYLTCLLNRSPIISQCPTGQAFDFTSETCTTAVVTTANCEKSAGNFLLTCTQAYFCPYVGAQPQMYTPCTNGQVYDLSAGICVPKGSITIPAFTCVGKNDGAIADNLECDAFRLCFGGVEQGTKNCCPSGQLFSEPIMRCTTDANIVTCPSKSQCDTNTYTYTCSGSNSTSGGNGSGTGTGTGTGTNCSVPICSVNGAYPYTSDCKQYYYCSGGKATPQKCPSQLFFDSTKKYCTTSSDSKGCSCV